MSKLERLIQQYCPDGVEWKTLGEVCDIHKGVQFNKTDMKEVGTYPVINGGINPSGYAEMFNEGKNTITISQGGASAGYVNFLRNKFWLGAHCYAVIPYDTVLNKYLYHFIKMNEITLQQCQYGAGIPALAKSTISSLEIPVPPLPVQEEIVRILDAFTELQAELQAELQKRQQQYNFYRDTLLTNYASEQNVKEYCLGELFEFKNGLNASKEQFGHGKPIVNYVNVYKKNSIVSSDLTGRVELDASTIERYRVKRGDVFFTRTSETREEVGFASVLLENIEDCVFSGFVLRARPITNVILPEFCKYCFATYEIRKQIIQSSTLTTRALTNGTSLSKVKIMIPPLEEQNRIVAILDRFDTLTNDLTSGLPAEMEKRRQQYEYYRDRLLTFKRL